MFGAEIERNKKSFTTKRHFVIKTHFPSEKVQKKRATGDPAAQEKKKSGTLPPFLQKMSYDLTYKI